MFLGLSLPSKVLKQVSASFMSEQPCNGLASHPGWSKNTPGHFMSSRKATAVRTTSYGPLYPIYIARASMCVRFLVVQTKNES